MQPAEKKKFKDTLHVWLPKVNREQHPFWPISPAQGRQTAGRTDKDDGRKEDNFSDKRYLSTHRHSRESQRKRAIPGLLWCDIIIHKYPSEISQWWSRQSFTVVQHSSEDPTTASIVCQFSFNNESAKLIGLPWEGLWVQCSLTSSCEQFENGAQPMKYGLALQQFLMQHKRGRVRTLFKRTRVSSHLLEAELDKLRATLWISFEVHYKDTKPMWYPQPNIHQFPRSLCITTCPTMETT